MKHEGRGKNKLLWRLVLSFGLVSIFLMLSVFVILNTQVRNVYYNNFVTSVKSDFDQWKSFLPGKLSAELIHREFDEEKNDIFFFRVSDYLSITVMGEADNVIYYSSDARFATDEGKMQLALQMLSSPNTMKLIGGNTAANSAKLLNMNGQRYFDYVVSYEGYIFYFMYESNAWQGITDKFSQIIYSTAILGALVSLFLGFVLSGTITRPLRILTRKAQEISSGNYDTSIPVKSDDEIGSLTRTFNDMGTEIKKSLNRVSGEKNKFETIINFMNDGIIAFNQEGELIQINPAATELLAISEQEKYDFGKFCEEMRLDVNIEDMMNEYIDTDTEKYLDIGDKKIFLFVGVFKNEQNKTEGVLAVLKDITEQTKLDNMRKEFVANVSHELRTPLTSIKLYSETLLADPSDVANNVRFLEVINSEADRMARLSEDLLQLSKVDSGMEKWNMQELDINEITEEVAERMRISAEAKQQTLELSAKIKLPPVWGDSDKLKQVIINIVSNAIKYTQEGGAIKMQTGTDARTVFVRVEDNGIGIRKEDQDRLFERFYRVDKARSRDMGGTGLGLSIAKEIVQAHGGTIAVRSVFGEGTEIKVSIPIKEGKGE